jgi:hypothetical protein
MHRLLKDKCNKVARVVERPDGVEMKGTDLSDISSLMDGESDNSMNLSSNMPMNSEKF